MFNLKTTKKNHRNELAAILTLIEQNDEKEFELMWMKNYFVDNNSF